MQNSIGPDDTIAEVLPTLAEPVEYVRAVLDTMAPCKKTNGGAIVRIGITGEGKMPYHKVAYINGAGTEVFYGAYGGVHPFSGVKIHENTWSGKSMTFEEVQALLGQLRNFKKKK